MYFCEYDYITHINVNMINETIYRCFLKYIF